jgi:hypothetical protein
VYRARDVRAREASQIAHVVLRLRSTVIVISFARL